MTMNELIEKRSNLWKAMDAFLKAQTNEKGVLSEEDDAKYAAMEHDFDNPVSYTHLTLPTILRV